MEAQFTNKWKAGMFLQIEKSMKIQWYNIKESIHKHIPK